MSRLSHCRNSLSRTNRNWVSGQLICISEGTGGNTEVPGVGIQRFLGWEYRGSWGGNTEVPGVVIQRFLGREFGGSWGGNTEVPGVRIW